MNIAALLLSLLVATAPAERQTVILVVGAPGTSEYAEQFNTWADRWSAAAGNGGAQVVRIGSESGEEPDKQRLRASIEAAIAQTGSPLWIVLIGHGTYDGRTAKFNLRDDDLSADELAEWLKPCKRPLAVINCTSASAPFLTKLTGQDRVIVTATRSGREIQFAHFGKYLSESISDPAADLDKDGQTSLLEAFIAGSHRVNEFYKSESRLATEHALLDDNGDGLGIPADWFVGIRATRSARDGAPLDGARAHQWHLQLSAAEQAMPPEIRQRRDEIELAIETLRSNKSTMSESDYYSRLEPLLIDLARLYEQGAK